MSGNLRDVEQLAVLSEEVLEVIERNASELLDDARLADLGLFLHALQPAIHRGLDFSRVVSRCLKQNICSDGLVAKVAGE